MTRSIVTLVAALSIVLTACGGAAGPSGAAAEPEKTDIVMGFVPSRDVNQIQASADSIAQYLSKETGYKVTSKTLTSYAAVAEGMTSKLIDIGWGGPFDYVTTHNQNGAYPITASVRFGVKGYKAFVLAKADSGINSLKDFKGKSFAFGDTLSASSNLYPKWGMQKEGLNPDADVKATKISNQSAIAIAVYQGQVDGGAIYDDARKNKEVLDKYPDIMTKTKVVWTSPLIPADPQFVRKDLNKTNVDKLQAAMIKLSSDPQGKVWLKDLFSIDSLVKADDSEYNELREIIKTVNPALLASPSPKK
ncbi:MAG: phosphate/phosphite/phosphonate ABC transporter substrate-binding protein [Candidatus Limnocylindrales bacterium]